jgi:sec-independent protein translocase protein TatA
MPPIRIGLPELIIILVIVILVFGARRIGDLGGALGKTVREFRKESKSDTEQEKKSTD